MFENFQEVTDLGVCGIYLLVQDEEVVYIGRSTSIWTRIGRHLAVRDGHHANDTVEQKEFNRIFVQFCPEEDLPHLEFTLWCKYNPRYNKAAPVGYHPPRGINPRPREGKIPLFELLNLKE